MDCLFEVKDGKAHITDHTRTIWFYNDLIDQYGEQLACKIFMVYHRMADLSLDNPFANVNEVEKLETVIRGTCPEITLDIDWNDPLILEGIDFTRKIYETPAYRKYLASKNVVDKLTYKLNYVVPDLSKESGNSGEIEKAYKLFNTLSEATNKLYSEYLEEKGTLRVRGQGIKSLNSRKNGGKSKELD